MSRHAASKPKVATRVYSIIINRANIPTLLFIDFTSHQFQVGVSTNGKVFTSETMLSDAATAYRALLLTMRALTVSAPAPVSIGLVTACTNSAVLLATNIRLARLALDWVFQYVGNTAIVHIRDLRIQDMPRNIKIAI